MTAVFINVTGLTELRGCFERLEQDAGKELAVARLDRVLFENFELTQQAVHVRTGALKLSGTYSSEFSGDIWRGVIEYGDPKTIHNGAPWEIARGGDHDFLAPTALMGDEISRVLTDWFSEAFDG